MLVGFGLVSGALSILAVTTRISLSWLMICLATLSMIAPLMRRRWPGGSSTWIALALVSPILVRAAGSEPAMWDDFWNWLPSAAYAYSHDSLVWPDLPPSFSKFPGYPQGMPLMIAAASFIGGRFLNQPATGGPPVPRPGVSVDVWDGFVDDAGRFTPQGPDYQGQVRRLRTRDGVPH